MSEKYSLYYPKTEELTCAGFVYLSLEKVI